MNHPLLFFNDYFTHLEVKHGALSLPFDTINKTPLSWDNIWLPPGPAFSSGGQTSCSVVANETPSGAVPAEPRLHERSGGVSSEPPTGGSNARLAVSGDGGGRVLVPGSKVRPVSAAVEVAVVVVEVGQSGLDSLSFRAYTAASGKSFGRVNLGK